MNLSFLASIVGLLAACPHPPTPPVETDTKVIGKAEWCRSVEALQPDDSWDCMWPPGRIDAGDYGPAKRPTRDSLFSDGLPATIVTERSSADITIAATRTVEVRANVGLKLKDLSSWLPDGSITANANASVTISFVLTQAKWRITQGVAGALDALLQADDQAAQGTRDALCNPDIGVTEGVLTGKLVAKVQVVNGASGGVALGWKRVGVDAGYKKNSDGSIDVTISDEPVALTLQRSSGQDVLRSRGLCDARDMTAAEKQQFGRVVQHVASGMLETYPCLFMRVGTEVSNNLCGGTPCTKAQVLQHYSRKLGTFTEGERQTVCDSVLALLHPMLDGTNLTLSCDGVTAWFEFHKGDKWCEMDFGGCSGGVLASPSMQIGIMRDVVARFATADQRDTFVTRFAAGWKGLAKTNAFGDAQAEWNKLALSCGAGGCVLPVQRANMTTNIAWDMAMGIVVERWLDYFSQQGVVDFDTACTNAQMCYKKDAGWSYEQSESGGDCFSWGGLPTGLDEAAAGFSKQLVP